MVVTGRIRARLVLAIVLTALIPIAFAIWFARLAVDKATARFYTPEIGTHLDQSVALYEELANAVKSSMRNAATAIAADGELRKAAAEKDRAATKRALDEEFQKYPELVSLTVLDENGKELASMDRGRPLDEKKENKLSVSRFLGDEPPPPDSGNGQTDLENLTLDEGGDAGAEEEPRAPKVAKLVAVFAADKARFEELDEMSQFVDHYKQIEKRREIDEASYLYAFAALLGISIVLAVGVGTFTARGVFSRLSELADATKRVALGDLSIRVPDAGKDEISDLAKAFNRMLGEVETSRARIEYLQRIGAWQEMARRLAHEIKNPLTPIQLAVQEAHRRYDGADPDFGKLLDTTREIVEDEVGTLRRLVSEFSSFARLPQAQLEPADLCEFLREQRERISLLEEEPGELDGLGERGSVLPRGVEIEFELPDELAMVNLDRQMLRRALINLIRNAGQAVEGAGHDAGLVLVRLSKDGEYWLLDIEDDGPGIPPEMRATVFDPYVTSKTEGTGLGLAIVKKIVVEHGGSIVAEQGGLGGARIRMRLPAAGTPAATAVLEAKDWQGPPSSGRPSLASRQAPEEKPTRSSN